MLSVASAALERSPQTYPRPKLVQLLIHLTQLGLADEVAQQIAKSLPSFDASLVRFFITEVSMVVVFYFCCHLYHYCDMRLCHLQLTASLSPPFSASFRSAWLDALTGKAVKAALQHALKSSEEVQRARRLFMARLGTGAE